ncbi:hypothetical protein ACFP6A_00275 [Quadrisphaera sp. GCM10027208]|uniref:hypothetical protein n=1 Tax=Quadrisphaera sp. GCM10027208 TaxID=3273423 RepID=UPI003607EDAF|nr:hypothetical protein HJG43_02970 [Kineosporiaceae bacterium SCSIO 59966]
MKDKPEFAQGHNAQAAATDKQIIVGVLSRRTPPTDTTGVRDFLRRGRRRKGDG